jgi:hypothetical protein
VIPIHLLTGPAHACPVDRELMFDLAPELRAYKPLWAWEDAFGAIDAMDAAGAAVVQGEILVLPEGGAAMQLPWEPWLPDPYMQVTPRTRRWWCPRKEDESWEAFVARAAAYAREWALALAARVTSEGAVHVDLAWATHDELALFDVPGGIQQARRRQVEQGGGPWAWMYGFSMRPRSIGEPAPGSYFGDISSDLAEIPDDARYASFSSSGTNLDRLADLTSLEVLEGGESSPVVRALLPRLPRLRELSTTDVDMSSVEWLGALPKLEFAYVCAGSRLRDPRPLSELPSLRYLFLDADGLRSLSGFAGCTQLTSLHVHAGSVDSLAPLGGLDNLRYLSVWTGRVADGSLAPLARLHGLRGLTITPGSFSVAELAGLAAALPVTAGPHLSPFIDPDAWLGKGECRRCGRKDVLVTAGKPRRVLCPACNSNAIQKHVIRWEILRSAAAAARARSSAG